jgi:quinol monooxygenase YgiN
MPFNHESSAGFSMQMVASSVSFVHTGKEPTMYGTVARLRVKPGMEEQLRAFGQEVSTNQPAGHVAFYVYRMDADPNEYYLTVVFESKEAYLANAASPEQDAEYRKLRALLMADPEWHDGEIIQTG